MEGSCQHGLTAPGQHTQELRATRRAFGGTGQEGRAVRLMLYFGALLAVALLSHHHRRPPAGPLVVFVVVVASPPRGG
ncbi:hypothetical protein AAVH_01206 [Aphelenchoides avenae]|nr:hypothetical protein AAVH_01206 [Aphelenchus avenae]